MSQRLRVLLPLGVGVAAILAALPFLRNPPPAEKDVAAANAKGANSDLTVDENSQSPAPTTLQVSGEFPQSPRESRILPPAIVQNKPSPAPEVVDLSPPPALPSKFPAPGVETLAPQSAFPPRNNGATERIAQRDFPPSGAAVTPSPTTPANTSMPPALIESEAKPAIDANGPASSDSPQSSSVTPSAEEAASKAVVDPSADAQAQPITESTPMPAVAATPPATPRPAPSPPAANTTEKPGRRHAIRDGDTLERIAERYLGNQQYADAIFNANRDVLQQRDLLPIGAEIVIPDVEASAG